MKITRRADALRDLDPLDASHFTGKAGAHPLLPAAAPLPPTSAAVVGVEAGVRKHRHVPAGGQLMVVIEGEGCGGGRPALPPLVEGRGCRMKLTQAAHIA